MDKADEAWIDIPEVLARQRKVGEDYEIIRDFNTGLDEIVEQVESHEWKFVDEEGKNHIENIKRYLNAAQVYVKSIRDLNMGQTASSYNDIIEIEKVDRYKEQINEKISEINSLNGGCGICIGSHTEVDVDVQGNRHFYTVPDYKKTRCGYYSGARPYTLDDLRQSEQYLELIGYPFYMQTIQETRPASSKYSS